MNYTHSKLLACSLAILLAHPAGAGAASIVVNTRADAVAPADGRCSLREAITASSLNVASGGAAGECAAGSVAPVRDTIRFSVGGRFRPTAANGQYPPLTEGYTTIDGWTAPAMIPGAKPRVVLDGGLLVPPFEIGIYLQSPYNIVRGLAIGRFADFGVYVDGAAAHHNWIAGNRIGTTRNGRQPRANGVGIVIQFGADENLVGTNGDGLQDLAEANLISANLGDGVDVSDFANRISGNRIGTRIDGAAALGNGAYGIVTTTGSSQIVVGTDGDGSAGDALEGNLLSGNGIGGLFLGGTGDHVVAGNLIGTDATASLAIGSSYGLEIAAGTNAIRFGTNGDGISDDFERNVISGNTFAMAIAGDDHIVAGNYIGTDGSGTFAIPNTSGITAPLDSSGSNGGLVIGGAGAAFRNVISGNVSDAIQVGSLDVTIECNSVGTDATGAVDLGNGGGLTVFATGTNPVIRANRFSYNSRGLGVYPPAPVLDGNIVEKNDTGLVWYDAGVLNAENSWWGDATGPVDAANPAGTGDSIQSLGGGTVDYTPWLAAEPVLCP